jgi:ABC-type uncharacterized transport system auxiliary subunit
MRFHPISALLVCILCGCASAPKIDYYTLGMESSGQTTPSVNLAVERFRSTEALNRSQIMVLASSTRIDYYATDHWAGSIGELVQRKLVAEFGPLHEGRKTLTVSGTVVSCEQVDRPGGVEARVELEIVLRDSESARYRPPLLEKSYVSSRPVAGASVASLVDELSRCVEDIAAQIAADVSSI